MHKYADNAQSLAEHLFRTFDVNKNIMNNIFLGTPPPYVAEWMIQHIPEPTDHTYTIFTLDDSSVERQNISGVIDPQCLEELGYFDNEEYQWLKSIVDVNVGTNVSCIGDYAFSQCDSLTNVIIPDSVESIGQFSFTECFNLQSITIGSGLTSVWLGQAGWGSSFSWCNNLTNITIAQTISQVEQLNYYRWLLPEGCIIHCTDGDIEIGQ